jgi:hypothetical protein
MTDPPDRHGGRSADSERQGVGWRVGTGDCGEAWGDGFRVIAGAVCV